MCGKSRVWNLYGLDLTVLDFPWVLFIRVCPACVETFSTWSTWNKAEMLNMSNTHVKYGKQTQWGRSAFECPFNSMRDTFAYDNSASESTKLMSWLTHCKYNHLKMGCRAEFNKAQMHKTRPPFDSDDIWGYWVLKLLIAHFGGHSFLF